MMRLLSVRAILVIACCLICVATASSKTLTNYIADLGSPDPQIQAVAAKHILNHPDEVPLIELERAILIAGQQRLIQTKQALIKILQDDSYRSTTRTLAANSLGLRSSTDSDKSRRNAS